MRVTPPSQPWHPPPAPLSPPTRPRPSAVDTAVTTALALVTLLAAVASFAFSGYFELATDNCGRDCGRPWVALAYLVTWGGLVVAALVAALGIAVAARRARPMWIWPALATILVFGSFAAGLALSGIA